MSLWRPFNTPNKLMTSWFQPDAKALQETERLLAHTYFLVKQGDAFGERLRCRDCKNRHNYITLKCVPKPITGLMQGLYAYYKAVKDFGIEASLSPQEKHRILQINQALHTMPDLASTHPQLARQLVKDLGPRDAQVGAISLGLLEGISPTEAKRYERDINDKGIYPPFRLMPVSRAETDRALEYRGLHYTNSRW